MSFTAAISSEVLPVDPGASATLTIEIVNRGTTTEPYEVSIEGVDPEWIAIPQPAVSLDAGQGGSVLVLFRPPRGPESAAGDYPFVARVRSLSAGESHGATGILRVKAFHHLTLEITPKKGSVSPVSRDNHFELAATNLGNSEHNLHLSGSDPEDACAYEFESEHLAVGPGQQREVELVVNPRSRSTFSSSRLVGFTTTARSVDAPTVVATTQAQLEVRPLLAPAMLAILAGLMILVGVLWAIQPKPPTITSLQVDRTTAFQGERVTVSWEAQGAKAVDLLVGGVETPDLPPTGTREIELNDIGTLTIQAVAERDGRRGEAQSRSVTVKRPDPVPDPKILVLKPSATQVRVGQSFVLTYKFDEAVIGAKISPLAKDLDLTLDSIQIPTDTPGTLEYTVVAQNKAGKRVSKSFSIEVIDPPTSSILEFSVSPKEVDPDATVTIRWSVTGASAIRLDYAGRGQDLPTQSGSIEVAVTTKTTFTLRAIDSRGKATIRSGTVRVKAPPPPVVLPEDGVDVPPTNDPGNTVEPPPTNG